MNTYQTTIYRPDMSLIYQAFTNILTEKFEGIVIATDGAVKTISGIEVLMGGFLDWY